MGANPVQSINTVPTGKYRTALSAKPVSKRAVLKLWLDREGNNGTVLDDIIARLVFKASEGELRAIEIVLDNLPDERNSAVVPPIMIDASKCTDEQLDKISARLSTIIAKNSEDNND